jgi:DNA polymerase
MFEPEKEEQLQQLNARMAEECLCALKEGAKQAVPGEGSVHAKILLIGEAPGKKEDEQGKPFIGAAGKFLGEMLASIGLRREDIYITNVVKYRPPNNRDPLPEEVVACWPWLREQVALIDPLLIVTLGRHSLERFVPGRKISEDHGKVFRQVFPDLGERNFYALYHPAAALYNGSLRATLLEDFKRIPEVLKALEKEHKNRR